jgi:hypothetical protein
MTETPIVVAKSKTDPENKFLVPVGSLLILLCAGYFFKRGFSVTYPQVVPISAGMSLLLLCINLISWYYYACENLYLYNDRLEIKTLYGYTKKVIFLNDITAYSLNSQMLPTKKKGKFRIIDEFEIFTDKLSHKVEFDKQTNYSKLRNFLLKGKYNCKSSSKKSVNYFRSVLRLSPLPFFLFFINTRIPNWDNREMVKTEDITTLEGVLEDKPTLCKFKKGTNSITFHFKQFPGFNFQAEIGYNLNDVATVLSESADKGDTLTVQILSDVYLKKIERKKTLSLFEKTFFYPDISVYGLKYHNINYSIQPGTFINTQSHF